MIELGDQISRNSYVKGFSSYEQSERVSDLLNAKDKIYRRPNTPEW